MSSSAEVCVDSDSSSFHHAHFPLEALSIFSQHVSLDCSQLLLILMGLTALKRTGHVFYKVALLLFVCFLFVFNYH